MFYFLLFLVNDSFLTGFFDTNCFQGGSTFAPKTHHGAAAASEYSSNARAPCFARPAVAESLSKNSVVQSQTPEQGFDTLDPPTFARPNRQTRGDQLHSEKKTCYSEIGG